MFTNDADNVMLFKYLHKSIKKTNRIEKIKTGWNLNWNGQVRTEKWYESIWEGERQWRGVKEHNKMMQIKIIYDRIIKNDLIWIFLFLVLRLMCIIKKI
jgi:hypothetical protein